MRIPPRTPPPTRLSATFLLAGLGGILLAIGLPSAPPGGTLARGLLLGAGVGLGGLPWLAATPGAPFRHTLCALLSGLLLGLLATVGQLPGRPRPLLPDPEAPGPRVAVGTLHALRPLGRSRLGELQLASLQGRPEERRLSVVLPPSAPPVISGDRVAAHLLLQPWPLPLNPGSRDPTERLLDRGLAGRARVVDLVRISTGRPGPLGGLGRRLRRALEDRRQLVRGALAQATRDPAVQGILTALAVGDGSALPRATRLTFARAGLSHLLAISGLHLGLLALGTFGLLRRTATHLASWGALPLPAGLREHPTGWAAGLTLLLTGLLVSWMDHPASGMRAGLMVIPLLLAAALRRRAHPGRALLAAFGLLLLHDPSLLSRVGFQLSCAAAAGLVLGARGSGEFLPRLPGLRWGLGLLEATFWATLCTAPLVLHHFGRLPATGLASNLVAIPLTGGLLVALTPAVLAAALWGAPAAPLFWPAHQLSRALEAVAASAAAWPGASFLLPPRAPWQIVAFLVLLLPALLPRMHVAGRYALALLAGSLLLWPTHPARPPSAPLEVSFLSVGHGDAIVVRTRAGDLLVDGGGDHRDDARQVGERIVVPALRALGITRLRAVFLTHPHPDHHGGLSAVLEAFPVDALYTNGEGLESFGDRPAPLARLTRMARTRGVPLRMACRDPLPDLSPVRLSCLWPRGGDPEGPWDPLASPNDNSVVLRLELGAVSFLLPGDLEAPGEAALLAGPPGEAPLAATVLKAPHHGSTTSSTPAFVERVAPEHVVYSVGPNNRFRFPRPSVVARWSEAGARPHRTDLEGTITFRTEGRSLQVRSFLRTEASRSAAGDGSRAPPGERKPSPPPRSDPGARDGRG